MLPDAPDRRAHVGCGAPSGERRPGLPSPLRGLAGTGILSREMTSCFWHSDSPSGCSAVGQPLTAAVGACSSPCELSGLGRGPAWTRSWLAAAGGGGRDAGPGRSKLLGIPHQQPNPHLHFQCLVSAAAAARVMIAKAQSFPDLLSGSRWGPRLGHAGSSSPAEDESPGFPRPEPQVSHCRLRMSQGRLRTVARPGYAAFPSHHPSSLGSPPSQAPAALLPDLECP